MNITVNLAVAMLSIVGGLAFLCLLTFLAMRRHSALAWLAAALVCGIFETIALDGDTLTALDIVIATIASPAAYFTVSQSIRVAFGAPMAHRNILITCASLTLLSLFLMRLPFPIPPVAVTLGGQLAGVVAMFDALLCLIRRRAVIGVLGHLMAAIALLLFMIILVRVPFFPTLLGADAPLGLFGRTDLQRVLIQIYAVLVPVSVLLIITRVVATTLNTYRNGAERDYLTGLPNRRFFEELARNRKVSPAALILCDVDSFKLVNDEYGHAAGDAMLRAFGSILQTGGIAARIGGDEFVLLLPGADLGEGKTKGDRLREAFRAYRLRELPMGESFSASFGVAMMDGPGDLQSAFERADMALSRAKQLGRNRCITELEVESPDNSTDQTTVAPVGQALATAAAQA
ncbi:GGDEF domain-containing protein [Altericroceibacterium endophyticum]|uniref:diguanylate cyclase n=1 Tax=Altericroceibacterium endophyticum TaxID=1808508 RepID=A0A6I4TA05_9SPHN|nr:GGDEF domain-containing protein [Altericroceibacterium endophyticum]MXO66991.1 diguanylate cyclase [Altericroceibacterium endophyticum]